jgi:hypothetical protein
LLIIAVAGKSNNPSTYSISGFSTLKLSATGGEVCGMFYKVAVLADESATTYSVTVGDSEVTSAIMLRVTGWDSGQTLTTLTSTQYVSNGIFTTMDLTPSVANSLIIFFAFVPQNGGTVSGYAIATSNPTWTVAQTVSGAFSTGQNGLAWAVRPETTSTGDFSITDSLDGQYGIAAIIAPTVASGPANLKSYDTNLKSNIKSINTNVIANIKSLNTNA